MDAEELVRVVALELEAIGVAQVTLEHLHNGPHNHLDDLSFLDQMSGLGGGGEAQRHVVIHLSVLLYSKQTFVLFTSLETSQHI